MKIDVVIPFHSKDKDTFRWCVQGIRNLSDTGRILGVCDQSARSTVQDAGAVFFDENACIQGVTPQSYPHKRWGWYFQQLLKSEWPTGLIQTII